MVRRNELGDLEKICHKCNEWWPATTEFFHTHGKQRRLHSPCKACIRETRIRNNRTRSCIEAGCNALRHPKGVYPRCIECERRRRREYHQRKKAELDVS